MKSERNDRNFIFKSEYSVINTVEIMISSFKLKYLSPRKEDIIIMLINYLSKKQ